MELKSESRSFDFVTLKGLLSYAEALVQRASAGSPHQGQISFPASPAGKVDRLALAPWVMEEISHFVQRVQKGLPDAALYQSMRQAILDTVCKGDAILFYAAWNQRLSQGALTPLLQAPIASLFKPVRRRPIAIVSREHLTAQLAEGRILLDLGDDRFLLLPRHLSERTLLFAMRHGVSQVESKTHRVGCRLSNTLDPERGIPKADRIGEALARMVGVIGQQLHFLHLDNYLDPKSFLHLTSHSPNTKELFERVIASLLPMEAIPAIPTTLDAALESQDFGWATGLEKTVERHEMAKTFGVEEGVAKSLIRHPLYCYPGGHCFFDFYLNVVDGFHRLAETSLGHAVCLYTHSATLRALITYLDPRPFSEAYAEFGEYKEGQDNVVLLAYERGEFSGYSTAVGLSTHERGQREVRVTVERERLDRVLLKPRQIRQVVVLVSGGDFAGAGAALKEIHVTATRYGLTVYFARHGFLGLANRWIEPITEEETRGMSSRPSSPVGSSRFEDFKSEIVQSIALENITSYMKNGALIILGGDGSLRGAQALYQKFGIQVVGLPGSIDNDLSGTTSLGFHSALALADQSIESLKATSAAMGSVFFVEIMGAGSGHLALACAYQARAEGVLVNEHPDPDAYIEEVILGTLKRTLGVPHKSHLFIVAEKTPHRHHARGGVHGLVDYIAGAISKWPESKRLGPFQMTLAVKETILGHTLRGATPTPEDKAMAQHLGYEAIRRLVEQPERAIGCMLAYRRERVVDEIPLYAITPKQFDWQLFARMHGNEV